MSKYVFISITAFVNLTLDHTPDQMLQPLHKSHQNGLQITVSIMSLSKHHHVLGIHNKKKDLSYVSEPLILLILLMDCLILSLLARTSLATK